MGTTNSNVGGPGGGYSGILLGKESWKTFSGFEGSQTMPVRPSDKGVLMNR
jgi:hypothetical protein